jgi:hypothetical protein
LPRVQRRATLAAMPETGALYAWVEVGPDGREGTIAVITDLPEFAGRPITLVFRERRIADAMRGYALAHLLTSGHTVRLVRFARAETIEEISTKGG